MEVEGQGKKKPAAVLVDITPAEVAMCHEFAERCSSLRLYSGSSGWRGGLVPPMKLYGGIEADKATTGITIGKVGEVALCKLANAPIDLALKDHGDGGKDLQLPSGVVQVKTSRKQAQYRFVRVPVESCDWFVFASWDGASPQVSIDGYVARYKVFRLESVESHVGRWMNKEVDVRSLFPIRQMLRLRPPGDVL